MQVIFKFVNPHFEFVDPHVRDYFLYRYPLSDIEPERAGVILPARTASGPD